MDFPRKTLWVLILYIPARTRELYSVPSEHPADLHAQSMSTRCSLCMCSFDYISSRTLKRWQVERAASRHVIQCTPNERRQHQYVANKREHATGRSTGLTLNTRNVEPYIHAYSLLLYFPEQPPTNLVVGVAGTWRVLLELTSVVRLAPCAGRCTATNIASTDPEPRLRSL